MGLVTSTVYIKLNGMSEAKCKEKLLGLFTFDADMSESDRAEKLIDKIWNEEFGSLNIYKELSVDERSSKVARIIYRIYTEWLMQDPYYNETNYEVMRANNVLVGFFAATYRS